MFDQELGADIDEDDDLFDDPDENDLIEIKEKANGVKKKRP